MTSLTCAVLLDVDVLRVHVADQQAHRRAGGEAFQQAADDLDAVGLLARAVELALAGPALVQLVLDHLAGPA